MRKFYNENLQHQYEHDSHFRSRVDSSEKKYSDLLKRAAKEPPGDGVNDNMLERFIGDDNHCTYFFYGHLQPSPNRGEKELLFYLVRNFQPEYITSHIDQESHLRLCISTTTLLLLTTTFGNFPFTQI